MELINKQTNSFALEALAQGSRLRKILSPTPEFSLIHSDDCDRKEMENYIASKFKSVYGAEVEEFFPSLLGMKCLGNFSGAAGMRPAGIKPLFLEQYLDGKIEDELSRKFERHICRNKIVEIGNLVATAKGASHIVFLIMTSMLKKAGYEWVVFTATNALQNNLNKLGFEVNKIKEADPLRLQLSKNDKWGNYYDAKPDVLVGRVDDAMLVIQKSPLFRKVKICYQKQIDQLAAEFRKTRLL